ncbi:glycosyltransferase family 4 protein [Tundrisphaera sp. TA3]|uniref:glycosyltransferase family 4 protein n=1 Tax=Tundrisphaera sp. TA3 TaxID=3435775 RepID=UPI003EB735FC
MKIIIRCYLENVSGIGQHIWHLAHQLERLGHQVKFDSMSNWSWLPDYFVERIAAYGEQGQVIQVCGLWEPCPPGAIYWAQWEADQLCEEYVANLNGARMVITSCEFAKQAFLRSGVIVPIEVIPLGVDLEEFHPIIEPGEECRFGVIANMISGRRKNIEGVIDAFRTAFHGDEVHLQLKINIQDRIPPISDVGISVVKGMFSTEHLRWWYNSLTCLVSGALGEGFGLCPLQAMACGRPFIGVLEHGHREYCDETTGYPVTYTTQACPWYFNGGNMMVPDIPSMAAAMRQVYEDRQTAIEKGKASLERAKEFTWEIMGARVDKVLMSL